MSCNLLRNPNSNLHVSSDLGWLHTKRCTRTLNVKAWRVELNKIFKLCPDSHLFVINCEANAVDLWKESPFNNNVTFIAITIMFQS